MTEDQFTINLNLHNTNIVTVFITVNNNDYHTIPISNEEYKKAQPITLSPQFNPTTLEWSDIEVTDCSHICS